jgi:hypothetical protein
MPGTKRTTVYNTWFSRYAPVHPVHAFCHLFAWLEVPVHVLVWLRYHHPCAHAFKLVECAGRLTFGGSTSLERSLALLAVVAVIAIIVPAKTAPVNNSSVYALCCQH